MNRIIHLPDHLKNIIAAGEVVEGPFSVVKELMENSIDASAHSVDVAVYDCGLKKITVRDDGAGILRDDITLSIQEHATSKIRDSSGLEKITTFGFRGEALSSIASISDIVILSKTSGESEGARLVSSAGEVTVSGFAGTQGTTVIVENLFYNTPARKKFLKSKKTELRNIRDTVLKMALPAYNISFTLEVDSKREITLPSVNSYDERIRQVFGTQVFNSLYSDELFDLKVKLKGYLSKPDFMKSSRNMQYLYINGRPVENRFLSFHLSRAYDAVIPRGKYPAAIIFMEIDPELVDVNIHPAKREVKLFDQKYIDDMIYNLALKSLNKPHSVPETVFKTHETEKSTVTADENINSYTFSNRPQTIPVRNNVAHSGSYSGNLFDAVNDEITVNTGYRSTGSFKILGTVFNTYILIEDNDRLHLIDFHAAHERMIYDRISENSGDIESQELMFPVTMELPVSEFLLVMENTEIYRKTGFEIEEFSDNTVIIRSVPVIIGSDKIEELIKNMIDNIKDGLKSNDLKERFYSVIACHSAKRSGDKLSVSDMESLGREVLNGSMELRCPHGRPFLFTINQNDLERMFKRL